MALAQVVQDVILHRFHCRDDEQAARARERRQVRAVLQQVLDLDRGVEGQRRELGVQRLDQAQRVAQAIEEVGVAEGDVLGSGSYLPASRAPTASLQTW